MTQLTTSHLDVEQLKFPFSAIYEKVRPHFSFELIAEEYQNKLQKSAQHIPLFCNTSMFFLFESPLTGTKRWGDFSLIMSASDCDFSWNPASLHQFPDWVPLVTFIEACRQNNLIETGKVKHIGIELDVGSLTQWPPVPSLFFGDLDTTLPVETVEEILYRCKEKKPSVKMLHQLSLASAAEFEILSIGLMFARPSSALRVITRCSKVLCESSCRSYLQSLGIQLETFQYLDLLESIKPFIFDFKFDLDIEDSTSSRFGVSCCFDLRRHFAEHKDRVGQMLEVLELKGLIDEIKRLALLSWVGPQLSTDIAIKNGCPFILRRSISHLKLIFSPQCPPEIKAYMRCDAVPLNHSCAHLDMMQGSLSREPLHILNDSDG